MSSLISCTNLSKSFSSRPLFEGINLNILESEKIGMLGPNGAGKSTLLKIFAGIEDQDKGEIIRKRNLKIAYLEQNEIFPQDAFIENILNHALENEHIDISEKQKRIGEIISVIGFENPHQKANTLSGGWRKRLSIAAQIIKKPDLMLLDEPTNHLDLEGINWLEDFLNNLKCSFILISHDRALLENVTSRIIEINRIYPQGFFSIDGNYSRYLEKREEHLESIMRYEESLRNKVRREVEWLRQGVKARTTKAKGRIQSAHKLIDELGLYQERSKNQGNADIDFLSSGRKTKKLLEVKNISKTINNNTLFENVSFVLTPRSCLGILGANGSGKSTLLNILDKSIKSDSGEIFWADQLKIVKFEQNRDALNKELSLKRALSPDTDHIIFNGNEMHVASWAKKFLFKSDQLEMPVRSLSGGEQARLLIAKLMLEPADILLLDEPTNDLDIETLQVLEESLEEFAGAVVLVTHDRFMLDKLSSKILAIKQNFDPVFFSSYQQYEEHATSIQSIDVNSKKSPSETSYKETKELSKLEKQIEKLEAKLLELKTQLSLPEITTDLNRLDRICKEIGLKEAELETLIENWTNLAEKNPT